ncbi:DUF4124 domain-containing protein [Shewanella maritima]|uniref:DUF4124 domain-containing protein n=1 Tax=Shewanella maritima TaxID=2520507 RepID=UPI003734C33C
MRILLLLVLLLISVSSAATVYRWVDENGKVHYSDEPVENAEVVTPNENTQNQVSLDIPQPRTSSSDSTQITDALPDVKISILSPTEESTIRQNSGNITVVSSITPKLPKGVFLSLYLDGELLIQPQISSRFELINIDRGEHTIVVKAVTQNGKVLASSSPRKVFLHRATL